MINKFKILKKIKLFEPFHDLQEENAILTTLKSNFWASGAGINNVKKFEDNSIDFLWFDAHLSEDQLEEELKCWYPKVAHGGIVGVHDCGNNGCDMDQVVYDFMDERNTEGNISYFNDTISWIKGHD